MKDPTAEYYVDTPPALPRAALVLILAPFLSLLSPHLPSDAPCYCCRARSSSASLSTHITRPVRPRCSNPSAISSPRSQPDGLRQRCVIAYAAPMPVGETWVPYTERRPQRAAQILRSPLPRELAYASPTKQSPLPRLSRASPIFREPPSKERPRAPSHSIRLRLFALCHCASQRPSPECKSSARRVATPARRWPLSMGKHRLTDDAPATRRG